MRVRVEPLRELDEAGRQQWRALAARAATPNPFSAPTIASPAAALLDDGRDAGLLTVSDGDRLVFAVPVVRLARFRRFPLSTLASWRHAHCCSSEPLIDPSAAPDAWAAVLDYVAEQGIAWLVLDRVDVDGPAIGPLRDVLAARGRAAHAFDAFDRAVVRRREAATYTEDRMSARHRSDLRRKRRGLSAALGAPATAEDVVDGATGVQQAVEAFLALEAEGWKGRAGTAMACRPEDAAFFRRCCADLHERGQLQLWRLGTPEHPAALACNAVAGDTVFRFKLAYDEELHRFSPGVLLELDMLDAFHHDSRLQIVDSCAGAGDTVYRRLYPDRRRTATLLVAPRSLPARIVAAAAPASARVYRRVRRRVYRLARREPPPDYGLLD